MPRARKQENLGLPKRWRLKHGAYYYQVPPGQESAWDGKQLFRLGPTLPEAYKVWSERIGQVDGAKTIGALLDRYLLEVVPKKGATTQGHNRIAVKPIRAAFGKMHLLEIKPRHVYKYVDEREAKTSAHREIEILSHAFTKAVEWGYIDRHPFKGEVRLEGEEPRDRYVEDWELDECLSLVSKRKKGSVLAVQAYIRIKRITGMSRGDMLRLRPAVDFSEEGIHIQRHKTAKKTGKRTIYLWTDELRAAVKDALTARPVDISPWLFCNRRGECYIDEETGRAGGWDSMWRGFMARVLAETKVTKRFTEHDMRAKAGSDADSDSHAQSLLSHASINTTRRIYRRKAERVKPIR